LERCAIALRRVTRSRAVIVPVVPLAGWEIIYERFLTRLLEQVHPQRITLGLCRCPTASRLSTSKMGCVRATVTALESVHKPVDGRVRYSRDLRAHIYRKLIGIIGDLDGLVDRCRLTVRSQSVRVGRM
jgi:spore photoproduct lyase